MVRSNVCERFLFLTAPALQKTLSRSLARSIRSRWAALLVPFPIASPSPWICSNSTTSLDRYPLNHFVPSFHLLLGWGEESVVETRGKDSSPWIRLSCGASCSGNSLVSYPSEAPPMRFIFMVFSQGRFIETPEVSGQLNTPDTSTNLTGSGYLLQNCAKVNFLGWDCFSIDTWFVSDPVICYS